MPPNRHTRNGTGTECKLGTDRLDWLEHRESAQRLSGLYAPVYLPDYRPQDFVGRAAQLALLRSTPCEEPSVFLLHGEPGAGKSTLALQFAWEVQKDFDAVIFQTCGRRRLDAITNEPRRSVCRLM